MDKIFFFIEFFKISRRQTDKINIFLWEFIKFDVNNTCGVAVVFEAVMIDEVDNVMKVQQFLLKPFIFCIYDFR